MRNRFFSGIVAGSLLGATIGMYAQGKMTSRQKRVFMRNGNKLLKNASNVIDDFKVLRIFQ